MTCKDLFLNEFIIQKEIEKQTNKNINCATDYRTSNTVNHPPYYINGRNYEPIAVINDWGLNFNLGNVIKYISRAGRKGNTLEDLQKAKWYLDHEIERLQTIHEGLKKDNSFPLSVGERFSDGKPEHPENRHCKRKDETDCGFA